MGKTQERTYTLKLTSKELWELKCNFDASYTEGAEGNEIAEQVSQKLADAWEKVPAKGNPNDYD